MWARLGFALGFKCKSKYYLSTSVSPVHHLVNIPTGFSNLLHTVVLQKLLHTTNISIIKSRLAAEGKQVYKGIILICDITVENR